MNNKEILGHIDHTLLQPTSTWEQIQVICEDAIRFGTASVLFPMWYFHSRLMTFFTKRDISPFQIS